MKLVQLAKTLHSTEMSDDSIASLKSDLYERLEDDYMIEILKPESFCYSVSA